jgi:transcriptional regulator with XRE-family HTH domain
LRRWRERRRVSQLALAVETGISAHHVSFIETGRDVPVLPERPEGIVTPQIEVRLPEGGVLAFFATVLTFGTAAEVNVSELSIELAFPADVVTAHLLDTLVGQPL